MRDSEDLRIEKIFSVKKYSKCYVRCVLRIPEERRFALLPRTWHFISSSSWSILSSRSVKIFNFSAIFNFSMCRAWRKVVKAAKGGRNFCCRRASRYTGDHEIRRDFGGNFRSAGGMCEGATMRTAKTIARLAVAAICLGRQLSAGVVKRILVGSLVDCRLKSHIVKGPMFTWQQPEMILVRSCRDSWNCIKISAIACKFSRARNVEKRRRQG